MKKNEASTMLLIAILSFSEVDASTRLDLMQQAEVFNSHNDVRRKEGASNMEILSWDTNLENMAAAYSDMCLWQHGQAPDPPSGYSLVGQNLYAVTGVKSLNITNITLEWYIEKRDYTFDSTSCAPDKMCGHYTQVVWASTRKVGCAYNVCSKLQNTNFTDASFFVCNYLPAGNYINTKPYAVGTACSQCSDGNFWCNNGLCDSTCMPSNADCACTVPDCQNGGSKDSYSCKCSGGNGKEFSMMFLLSLLALSILIL